MSPKITRSSFLFMPNSQFKIPQIGFGVFESLGQKCVQSCLTALKVGYRHIDTAQFYENEEQVGQAIRESNVPRSELFITSKILSPEKEFEATYKRIIDSVEKIDGPRGYVDLFLIHNANSCGGAPGRKLLWEALEKAKEAGKVRDIGVSNYGIQHIEEMKGFAKTWPPPVNQIELHPWCQQREIVEYCQTHKIVIQAYCPLARNTKADDPTLLSVAEKCKHSTGQILIRYSLQKGWVPLPKSDTPSRIQANADVYDFEIEDEDMAKLDALNQGAAGALVEVVEN